MRVFLRCLTSVLLTAVIPVLAQDQPASCYTTTTVVFGDPQSILESLSLASNFTDFISSPSTSTIASSLALTASLASPTTSTAIQPVTGLFRISMNVPGPEKLRSRAIEYVSFLGDDGILVTDPAQATLFKISNGYLQTSTGFYIGASTNNGSAQFQTFGNPPPVAQGWTVNSDGIVSLNTNTDFCYAPNDSVYIVFNEKTPSNCTIAILTAAFASAASSASIVSSSRTPTSMIGVASSSSSGLITTSVSSLQPLNGQTFAQSSSTSTSTSIIVLTSSSVSLVRISTQSASILGPLSLSTSSSSASSIRPLSSISSSSALVVTTNPTSVAGPGQLSTQVSSVFSLPIVISSISSSTAVISSLPAMTSSILISSKTSISSGFSSSTAGTASSPASITTSCISLALYSSIASSALTTSLISSPFTSTLSISSTSLPAVTSPYQRNAGKRGLAYTNITLTQLYSLQGQDSKVSWAYDYYSLPNASNNVGPVNPALTFIPLLYNTAASLTSIWSTNVQSSIADYGTDALFSFNEPDACNNGQSACMSVNASVLGYQTHMQPFAGRVLLGAPSITNGAPPASLTYLSYFLGNCTGCTVDFINLHWYSSPYSFSYLTSYIQQAYQVGGQRPIYLTEFGMDSVYYAETDVATFLKNATTWLDSQSYVHRYAWFGDFAQNGPANQQGFGYLVNASGNALSSEGVVFNNYTGGYVPCPLTSGC